MGSVLRAVIALYIVFSAFCPQSVADGTEDSFSSQPAGRCEVTLHPDIKHPALRKNVAGPWPRFAKEMLA